MKQKTESIKRGTIKWLIEKHARWYRIYGPYLIKAKAKELQSC